MLRPFADEASSAPYSSLILSIRLRQRAAASVRPSIAAIPSSFRLSFAAGNLGQCLFAGDIISGKLDYCDLPDRSNRRPIDRTRTQVSRRHASQSS